MKEAPLTEDEVPWILVQERRRNGTGQKVPDRIVGECRDVPFPECAHPASPRWFLVLQLSESGGERHEWKHIRIERAQGRHLERRLRRDRRDVRVAFDGRVVGKHAKNPILVV